MDKPCRESIARNVNLHVDILPKPKQFIFVPCETCISVKTIQIPQWLTAASLLGTKIARTCIKCKNYHQVCIFVYLVLLQSAIVSCFIFFLNK